MGIDKNPIQSGSQSGRKAFCNNFAVFAVYTVIVTLLHFVCITGRCCKRQHLVQPTTLGLWGPSGISVGTDVICSYTQPSLFLYTAHFTHHLTSTCVRTMCSFLILPLLLTLVPLSNRQRRVSNMSRLDGFKQTQT